MLRVKIYLRISGQSELVGGVVELLSAGSQIDAQGTNPFLLQPRLQRSAVSRDFRRPLPYKHRIDLKLRDRRNRILISASQTKDGKRPDLELSGKAATLQLPQILPLQ